MKKTFSRQYLSHIHKIKHKKIYYISFIVVLIGLNLILSKFPQINPAFVDKNNAELSKQFIEHIVLLENKVNTLCSNVMVINATSDFVDHYSNVLKDQKLISNNASLISFADSKNYNVQNLLEEQLATPDYWIIYNKIHPVLKTYANKFDIIDITIIDPAKTFALYSVRPQPYSLKPLLNKTTKNTEFITTIKRVDGNHNTSLIHKTEFTNTDAFELYIAAPVNNTDETVGYLVFRFALKQFENTLALQDFSDYNQ